MVLVNSLYRPHEGAFGTWRQVRHLGYVRDVEANGSGSRKGDGGSRVAVHAEDLGDSQHMRLLIADLRRDPTVETDAWSSLAVDPHE